MEQVCQFLALLVKVVNVTAPATYSSPECAVGFVSLSGRGPSAGIKLRTILADRPCLLSVLILGKRNKTTPMTALLIYFSNTHDIHIHLH